MTYNKSPIVSLTVSTLKGNTLGVLEKLDGSVFKHAVRLRRQHEEEIRAIWEESDIILLGVSTYSSKFSTSPEYPAQLRRYRKALEDLEGKKIILFGSGRSEYPVFCGALDFLEQLLKEKNQVLLKYKFEGYPRESEKIEFKNHLEGIFNETIKI